MYSQNLNPPENVGEVVYIRVKRLPRYPAWIWKVRVLFNGIPIDTLANGAECFRKIKVGSTIDVEAVTFAWRNTWSLYITDSALVEFGYSFWGSGYPFRYQNVKLINHYGCRLLHTGLEKTLSQKICNWVNYVVILILIFAKLYPGAIQNYLHLY